MRIQNLVGFQKNFWDFADVTEQFLTFISEIVLIGYVTPGCGNDSRIHCFQQNLCVSLSSHYSKWYISMFVVQWRLLASMKILGFKGFISVMLVMKWAINHDFKANACGSEFCEDDLSAL